MHYCQYCQLSWIIQQTPDFGLYLPVSILESDTSRIIAKIAISCTLVFPTIKFQIFCIVWAAAGMFSHKFWYNMNCLCAIYIDDRINELFLAQKTSFAVWYDVIYHFFLYQFSIFDDVGGGGWQPCTAHMRSIEIKWPYIHSFIHSYAYDSLEHYWL